MKTMSRVAALALAAMTLGSGAAFAQTATVDDLANTIPTIIVRGTPLPTLGFDPKMLAAPVQVVTGEEMERIVRDAYALPEPVVQKVRRALTE